jgi:uncharacterized protein with PQ loop repeat
MWNSIPTLAGTIATLVFACSAVPMLGKAVRSKDLTSYSTGSLVLANVGNAFYSVYVFHLPPGPIWALHAFYLVSSGLMLFWSRRYTRASAGDMREPTHVP